MVCSAGINGRSCCSTCLLMGAGRSGAKPLILRQGGHAEKGGGGSGILLRVRALVVCVRHVPVTTPCNAIVCALRFHP